jgi:hypothetical protein
MKNIITQHGRSILAGFFLAVMVGGPLCAIGGIIVSSLGANLISFIATVLVA